MTTLTLLAHASAGLSACLQRRLLVSSTCAPMLLVIVHYVPMVQGFKLYVKRVTCLSVIWPAEAGSFTDRSAALAA